MNIIAITPSDEATLRRLDIAAMLRLGAARVHLRTIDMEEDTLRGLIESIPAEYRRRVSLHEHFALAEEYGMGVHLNRRHPEAPADFKGTVSRSCHSIEELKGCDECDYMFLSPVFDSISKRGYHAAFTFDTLADARDKGIIDARVIALGGVRPALFGKIRELGFGGAAMLGAAWNPVDINSFRLQYITPDSDDIASDVRKGLEGGCRWVQLRMKDATAKQILAAAAKIEPLCHSYGATFLLDDHVELVEATRADGVHLGKNDMPVDQARQLLGPGYIVGATANTFDDIAAAASAGASYIGLGPLRFTTTKKNLSPVLGYDGYREILAKCRENGISLPVVAIGSVDIADIEPLFAAGASGVAVSGAITRADDPSAKTAQFIKSILINL